MGKLGDLWVRLGLKSDEYVAGVDKSKKKTEELKKPVNDVKGAFEGLKKGALAVWGAIGAAVVAFGKEMLKTTNAVGDAWQMFTAQATAGWKTFVQAVSNFDFDGFVGKFRDAVDAARDLQSALDYEFEVTNSIRIQKAMIEDELEVLRIAARDQRKSQEERLAATEEYMRKITPIYNQEIQLANELLDAWQGKWLAGTNLKDTPTTREDLMKFLVDYGRDRQLAAKLSEYIASNAEIDSWRSILNAPNANPKAVDIARGKVNEHNAIRNWLKGYGQRNGYNTFVGDLADIYENWRGDEDTMPLVEALVNAGKAQAGLNRETRQIQNIQNSILAQLEQVAKSPLQETLEEARASIETAIVEDMAILDKANDLRVKMAANGDLPKMSEELQDKIDALAAPELFSDKWVKEQKENLDELQKKMAELGMVARKEAKAAQTTTAEAAASGGEAVIDLSGAIANSLSGGIQALSDMAFGLEGAGMEQALYAFLMPFAESMKQAGAMIAGFGASMAAFQVAWTNPAAAIAAGSALMVLGSAVSSGLKAIISSPTGGGSSTSYGGGSYGNVASTNYEAELTVNVVGHISGSDIALSLDRTRNKQKR